MPNAVSLPELHETTTQQRVSNATPEIAILIPCFNEELTIGDVIAQFQRELPNAKIYVFDSNSTELTAERARQKRAILLRENRRRKRYVLQRLFREFDADIYEKVDVDG